MTEDGSTWAERHNMRSSLDSTSFALIASLCRNESDDVDHRRRVSEQARIDLATERSRARVIRANCPALERAMQTLAEPFELGRRRTTTATTKAIERSRYSPSQIEQQQQDTNSDLLFHPSSYVSDVHPPSVLKKRSSLPAGGLRGLLEQKERELGDRAGAGGGGRHVTLIEPGDGDEKYGGDASTTRLPSRPTTALTNRRRQTYHPQSTITPNSNLSNNNTSPSTMTPPTQPPSNAANQSHQINGELSDDILQLEQELDQEFGPLDNNRITSTTTVRRDGIYSTPSSAHSSRRNSLGDSSSPNLLPTTITGTLGSRLRTTFETRRLSDSISFVRQRSIENGTSIHGGTNIHDSPERFGLETLNRIPTTSVSQYSTPNMSHRSLLLRSNRASMGSLPTTRPTSPGATGSRIMVRSLSKPPSRTTSPTPPPNIANTNRTKTSSTTTLPPTAPPTRSNRTSRSNSRASSPIGNASRRVSGGGVGIGDPQAPSSSTVPSTSSPLIGLKDIMGGRFVPTRPNTSRLTSTSNTNIVGSASDGGDSLVSETKTHPPPTATTRPKTASASSTNVPPTGLHRRMTSSSAAKTKPPIGPSSNMSQTPQPTSIPTTNPYTVTTNTSSSSSSSFLGSSSNLLRSRKLSDEEDSEDEQERRLIQDAIKYEEEEEKQQQRQQQLQDQKDRNVRKTKPFLPIEFLQSTQGAISLKPANEDLTSPQRISNDQHALELNIEVNHPSSSQISLPSALTDSIPFPNPPSTTTSPLIPTRPMSVCPSRRSITSIEAEQMTKLKPSPPPPPSQPLHPPSVTSSTKSLESCSSKSEKVGKVLLVPLTIRPTTATHITTPPKSIQQDDIDDSNEDDDDDGDDDKVDSDDEIRSNHGISPPKKAHSSRIGDGERKKVTTTNDTSLRRSRPHKSRRSKTNVDDGDNISVASDSTTSSASTSTSLHSRVSALSTNTNDLLLSHETHLTSLIKDWNKLHHLGEMKASNVIALTKELGRLYETYDFDSEELKRERDCLKLKEEESTDLIRQHAMISEENLEYQTEINELERSKHRREKDMVDWKESGSKYEIRMSSMMKKLSEVRKEHTKMLSELETLRDNMKEKSIKDEMRIAERRSEAYEIELERRQLQTDTEEEPSLDNMKDDATNDFDPSNLTSPQRVWSARLAYMSRETGIDDFHQLLERMSTHSKVREETHHMIESKKLHLESLKRTQIGLVQLLGMKRLSNKGRRRESIVEIVEPSSSSSSSTTMAIDHPNESKVEQHSSSEIVPSTMDMEQGLLVKQVETIVSKLMSIESKLHLPPTSTTTTLSRCRSDEMSNPILPNCSLDSHSASQLIDRIEGAFLKCDARLMRRSKLGVTK